MLPKGNVQQKGYFAYRALCAVIHVVWIAAFLSLMSALFLFAVNMVVHRNRCV